MIGRRSNSKLWRSAMTKKRLMGLRCRRVGFFSCRGFSPHNYNSISARLIPLTCLSTPPVKVPTSAPNTSGDPSDDDNAPFKRSTFFMLVSTFYPYQLFLCLSARLMLVSSFHAYQRPRSSDLCLSEFVENLKSSLLKKTSFFRAVCPV